MPAAFVAIGEYVVYFAAAAGASTATAVAIGGFVTAALTYGTYYFLLNKATQLLLDKNSGRRANSGLEVAITDSAAEGMAIYGSMRVNGINKIPPITGGTDGRYLEQVIELCLHDCQYVPAFYADQLAFSDHDIQAFGGSTNDGKLFNGKYKDHLFVRRYYSMTQFAPSARSVDFSLNSRYPTVFTSDFVGRGRTYVAITYDYGDGQVFTSGLPNMTFVVNGKLCYDPRKDSTQSGGSGAHRYTDETTWEWTSNPALHWADYAMADFGGNVDPTKINWASVMASANICDATVYVPDPFMAYATGGSASLTGNDITKTAGGDAWDASVRSTASETPSERPYVSAQMVGGFTNSLAVGLTTDPTTNNSYDSIDYCWIVQPTTSDYAIYENGVGQGTFTASGGSITAVMEIFCDGEYIHYYLDGRLCRIIALTSTTAPLFVDTSIFHTGDTARLWVQRRYTSNVRIGLARDWKENAKIFIDAMVGRMVRRDGLWFIYAGAYDAPTFTIEKKDWVQIETIRAIAPRDGGRWNTTRVWYTDRWRNWQREECFPRRNATYRADDAGEEIPLELEQPACVNEWEAQRKGEFLLRQSRNQVALVGVLPPRFHFIATGEMGTFTFEDFGWQTKIMRVRAMDLLNEGQVRVSISEEQAADWTDMTTAEYNAPSISVVPANNPTSPSAPSVLLVETELNGTLTFAIGQPLVFPKGTNYQLIRSTVSTNAAVGTIVWQGVTQRATITAPASVHYYFARAYCNSFFGPYYPNTTGISAVPLGWLTAQINSNAATDVTLVNNAGAASSNSTAVGPILQSAWTSPGCPAKALLTVTAVLRRSTFAGLSRADARIGALSTGNVNIVVTSDQLHTFQLEGDVASSTATSSFGLNFDCGTFGNIAWSNVRAKLELIKL